MYYIDIGIISDESDRNFCLTTLLCSIHEQSNKWKVALSFPKFKIGEKKIDKIGYTSYAKIGNIIRLFSSAENILNEILNNELISSFKKKRLIVTTKTQLAPNSNKYEYYVRDQTENYIRIAKSKLAKKDFTVEEYNGKKINKNSDYWKKRLESLQIKNKKDEINKFYLLTYSKSKNTNFSLFIERKISDVGNNSLIPTSYGLSNKENINYLPIFESTLSL